MRCAGEDCCNAQTRTAESLQPIEEPLAIPQGQIFQGLIFQHRSTTFVVGVGIDVGCAIANFQRIGISSNIGPHAPSPEGGINFRLDDS